ncbi:MAG TPA: hypothetical protein VGO62_06955 [Myxococcota bacterium]
MLGDALGDVDLAGALNSYSDAMVPFAFKNQDVALKIAAGFAPSSSARFVASATQPAAVSAGDVAEDAWRCAACAAPSP